MSDVEGMSGWVDSRQAEQEQQLRSQAMVRTRSQALELGALTVEQ